MIGQGATNDCQYGNHAGDRQNAGAIQSATGGPADIRSHPLPWIGDFGAPRRAAAGRRARECLRAPARSLKRNARVIKGCASGGVLSDRDGPIRQKFTLGELRAIV